MWFWHTLALALGGRTVAELQASMSQREFQAWVAYYRAFPFDDLHRYHRPAALVAHSVSVGGDVKQKLEWLSPEPIPEGLTEADWNTMKALGGLRPGMKG